MLKLGILDDNEYEVGYEDIDVVVHGGLTWGVDDDGWVGFDTAHHTDHISMPGFSKPGRVWTVEDVKAELEQLAEQLAERSQ